MSKRDLWQAMVNRDELCNVGLQWHDHSSPEMQELCASFLRRPKRPKRAAALTRVSYSTMARGFTSDEEEDGAAEDYAVKRVLDKIIPWRTKAKAASPTSSSLRPARGSASRRKGSVNACATGGKQQKSAAPPTTRGRRGPASLPELSLDVVAHVNLRDMMAMLERKAAEPKSAQSHATRVACTSEPSASTAIVRAAPSDRAAPPDHADGDEEDDVWGDVVEDSASDGPAAAGARVALKGPHLAKNETIAHYWELKRPRDLSTHAHPLQFALLKECFCEKGPLHAASPVHGPAFFSTLVDASMQIEAIMKLLFAGWNDGMSRMKVNGAVQCKLEDLSKEFYDWYPAMWTYRYFVNPGVESNSHANEFFNDMFESTKRGPCAKPHPFWEIAFYRDHAMDMLRERRGGADAENLPEVPQNNHERKIWETKAVMRATIGPLRFHELVHAHELSDALQTDTQKREVLGAAFDGLDVEAVMNQCCFDRQLQAACTRVAEAHSMLLDPETKLFGSPVNDTLRNGSYALSSMHTNMQANVEEVQRYQTWALRIFHRLIHLQDERMVDKNYKHVVGPPTTTSMRRVSTASTAKAVLSTGNCGMTDTIHALICTQLFILIKLRWQAFSDAAPGDARLPESFRLPPCPANKQKAEAWPRTFLTGRCGMCKNAPDSYKDCSKMKTSKAASRKSLAQPSGPRLLEDKTSTQSDDRRRFETVALSIMTLGVDVVVQRFPEALETSGLGVLLPGHTSNAGLTTPQECFDRHACTRKDVAFIQDAFKKMPWITTELRRPVSELLCDVRALVGDVKRAISFFKRTCEVIARLRAIYERELQLSQARTAERRRDTSSGDSAEPEWRWCDIEASSLSKAISRIDPNDARRCKMLVNITVDSLREWIAPENDAEYDDNAPPPVRTTQCLRLEGWYAALVKYEALLCEAQENAGPTALFFDFLVSCKQDIANLARLKDNAAFDPIDFAKLTTRCNKSTKSEAHSKSMHTISAFSDMRDEVNLAIIRSIRAAFEEALSWSDVFSSKEHRVVATSLTHLNIGVSSLVLLLSVAAVYDAVFVDVLPRNTDVASIFVSNPTACFFVGRVAGEPDMRVASEEALMTFAKSSDDAWKCVCALAVVSRDVLGFRSCTRRAMSTSAMLITSATQLVALRDDERVLTRFEARLADPKAALQSLTALGADGEPIDLIDRVESFPPSVNWTFSDNWLERPDHFAVLLSFVPTLAHANRGFYTLVGGATLSDAAGSVVQTIPDVVVERPRMQFYHLLNHPLSTRTTGPFTSTLARSI